MGVGIIEQPAQAGDCIARIEARNPVVNAVVTRMYDEARKAIVDSMQRQFYDDAAYLIMWYQDKLQGYRTDTWQGWQPVNGGMVLNFTRDNYLKVRPA